MLKLFLGSALSELKVMYAKYNFDTYINYNSHKMWNNFLHFLPTHNVLLQPLIRL